MKKTIFAFLAGITFTALLSFTIVNYQIKESTAEVNELQGLKIFVDSKPLTEYEYLGTVTSNMYMGSSQYTSKRDRLIKLTKKKFPSADGVIFAFKTGSADRCDAIKFKK